MSRFRMCLLLVFVAATVGCNRGPRTSWDLAVTQQELAEADLEYHWQVVLPLDDDEDVVRLWHLDENVYYLTDHNRVHVYNAVNGEHKWTKQLCDPGRIVFAPCHADNVPLSSARGVNAAVNVPADATTKAYDVVIFNTITEGSVYRRDTGQKLQSIDFSRAKFAAYTGTACDGSRIFVGSVKGRYYALELQTGLTAWKLSTKDMIIATPVAMGPYLFVASHDGTIYATRIGHDRGEKIWPRPEAPQGSAGFDSDFVVEERGLFAGCQDYSVYAFDPVTGKQLWRSPCGGPITRPVQVGRTNVYARADRDALYALDLVAGERAKWTLPDGLMVLAEIGENAMVLNRRNQLMVVDAAIGKVRTVVPLAGLTLFVPNTKSPAIFAANADGLVCRLSPRLPRHAMAAEQEE